MLALDLPRPDLVKTPMLVLGGAKDAIFSPQEVESTAHAYQSEAQIFPDMAHDLMLEPKWQTVAQRMADWLRELELDNDRDHGGSPVCEAASIVRRPRLPMSRWQRRSAGPARCKRTLRAARARCHVVASQLSLGLGSRCAPAR